MSIAPITTAPEVVAAAASASPSTSISTATASSTSVVGADLFPLGRRAAAARDARLGARGSFVRSRQLLGDGSWRGPRDAAESWVDVADLAALSAGAAEGASRPPAPGADDHGGSVTDHDGAARADDHDGARAAAGWAVAAAAGATLLVGGEPLAAHRAANAAGGRSLWRFRYRSGEAPAARQARLAALVTLARGPGAAGLSLWGVMPSPEGEPEGLDTLALVAALRLALPEVPHVVLDVAALGPRLAQMALGFGGDELWAPIVSERALRIGGNAGNPAMTRKEAAILLRGAGLAPRERLGPDLFSEEVPL